MEEHITHPGMDMQALLDEVLDATPETITFRNSTYKIGWLRNGTYRMYSHIVMTEKDTVRRGMKLVACVLLNDTFIWWRKLLFPFYWRWLYYARDISMSEVVAVQAAAQKKTPFLASYLSTILATAMLDTGMATRKGEAVSTQAAPVGAAGSH